MNDWYICKQTRRDTQQYVSGCNLCHQTNHWSSKPILFLQPLLISKGHWQRVGIDVKTDLLTSENSHNCIVTFVDHMTKRAHWHACKKTIDVPTFACIFINDIVHLHAVPQEVVFDHEVCFTAADWREVARIPQSKLLQSTAFHSETDGLSENSNKTVICYFCGFASHNHAKCDDYLPLVEYA